MSGHSKWATIKRKKEATDAKRSNMFAKLLRAVEVAAREGGGNVDGNMTLARRSRRRRRFSVPNDNIDRAIKRGHRRAGDGAAYEEVIYEGYAPGGIGAAGRGAHRQPQPHGPGDPPRVHPQRRATSARRGVVAWQFTRKGVIVVEKAVAPDEERLLEIALEGGAEDLERLARPRGTS